MHTIDFWSDFACAHKTENLDALVELELSCLLFFLAESHLFGLYVCMYACMYVYAFVKHCLDALIELELSCLLFFLAEFAPLWAVCMHVCM